MGYFVIEFSRSAVYIFLLVGVLIFIMFRISRWTFRNISGENEMKKILSRYFPVFEILIWFIFMIWAIQYFWNNNQLYSFAMIFVLMILVIWVAWYALKDYIAGVIFKTGKRIQVNEKILVDEYSGKIRQFNNRTLELERETGEIVIIPYSYLFGKIIVKTQNSQIIQKHTFQISCEHTANTNELLDKIHRELLINPFSLSLKDPQISLSEKSKDNKLLIDIVVYSFDKQYFYNIEKDIRDKFEGTKPDREA